VRRLWRFRLLLRRNLLAGVIFVVFSLFGQILRVNLHGCAGRIKHKSSPACGRIAVTATALLQTRHH
jgi:hypothetical protein